MDRIAQIRTIFSQTIESVQVHSGDDFDVVQVSGEWMFRFPRNSAARQVLNLEKRFLPRFAQVSPLPIPQLEYVAEDFVGYRKIEGTLLTAPFFYTLPRETQRAVAGQMGEFLSAIHTFPLDEAREIGLTEGWGGWRRQAYRRFKADVAPLLSPQARKNALDFFDRFFALQWKPVVIHGDFYPADHIFFDEAQQTLCGAIDFGDLTIEDAATDLKSILEDFGANVLRDVLAHYSGEVDAELVNRIRTRIEADPLFDASYALEYGYDDRFSARLQEIEVAFGAGAVNCRGEELS